MILYRECILKHSSFPLFLLCPGLWQPFFGSAEHRKRNPTDRLPGRWGDLFSVGRGNEVEPQKWWWTTPPPEQSFVGNFFPFEGGDLSKHVWWQFLCFLSSLLHFDWIPNPPNCRWRSAVRCLSTFHPRQIGIRGPRWPRFRRHHLICRWLGVSEIRCKTARHIARVHSFWGYDTWNFYGWLLKFLVFSFGTPRLREGFLNFEQHMSCFFRWFKPATFGNLCGLTQALIDKCIGSRIWDPASVAFPSPFFGEKLWSNSILFSWESGTPHNPP